MDGGLGISLASKIRLGAPRARQHIQRWDVRRLVEMKDELELLLQRLHAGDRSLKRSDFEILSDVSRPEQELFSDLWPEVPLESRRSLISALAVMTDECFEYNFDRIFRRALDDPDPIVRVRAIEGLWESEDPALIGPYVYMVEHDASEDVRAAAAGGLGRFVYLAELEEIGQSEAMAVETALLTLVYSPQEPLEVRRQAVESLGFSCNPDVQDVIRDAYEAEDPRLRASAVVAMGRSANRRWRGEIMRELGNTDEEIRFEAVRAAGELELRESVPILAHLLDTGQKMQLRLAAIQALGQVGGEAARGLLERVLEGEDESLYGPAQDALEELSFADECPEILDLLRLSDDAIRDDEDDEDLAYLYDQCWTAWDEDEEDEEDVEYASEDDEDDFFDLEDEDEDEDIEDDVGEHLDSDYYAT